MERWSPRVHLGQTWLTQESEAIAREPEDHKRREFQYEIIYMHDSKDFKDAESMHSGPLSHVPCESALFPHQDDQGGLLGRAKVMPPKIWDTPCTSGNVFASPLVYLSTSFSRIPTPWDDPDAGRIPGRTSTGKLVPGNGSGGKDAMPTPRFLRSSSTGNSFDAMEWRNFKRNGVKQRRLQIPELHFDKFPYSTNIFVLEDKVQDGGMLLFKYPHGSDAVDQRSGDGYFSGRFKIFAIYSGSYSFS